MFDVTVPNIDDCELIDEFDVEATADDGYSIPLYKAADGRHFIYIRHSDYGSKYAGALGFDQWVEDDQVANWTDL